VPTKMNHVLKRGPVGANYIPLMPFMGSTNLQHIQYIWFGTQLIPTKHFQNGFCQLMSMVIMCLIPTWIFTNWISQFFFACVSSTECHSRNAWNLQHLVWSKIWHHYVSKRACQKLGFLSSALLWLVPWLSSKLHSYFREVKVRVIWSKIFGEVCFLSRK
jgi:hypothetical protein